MASSSEKAALRSAFKTRAEGDVSTLDTIWAKNEKVTALLADINGTKASGFSIKVAHDKVPAVVDGSEYIAPSLVSHVSVNAGGELESLSISMDMNGVYKVEANDEVLASTGVQNAAVSAVRQWLLDTGKKYNLDLMERSVKRKVSSGVSKPENKPS